jgi:hypothetical protein
MIAARAFAQMSAMDPAGRRPTLQRKCACGGKAGPDGECAECRKKRRQGQATAPQAGGLAPPIVNEVLRSPGQPLDAATRAFVEPRFGYDFGNVRVHADAKANESARAVHAQAYTVGQNIVFGAGRHGPNADGRKLLAHELAHVVQQRSDTPSAKTQAPAMRQVGSAEREADASSNAIARGQSFAPQAREPVALARQPDAGVPDAGVPDAGPANRGAQVECVKRRGGCANTRPGGIPTPEEIAGYNQQCRQETGYTGPDVTPTDEECRGTPPAQPAAPTGCKVDVRATHISGLASYLPIWHLYLVYTDKAGKESFFRGGPGGHCAGATGQYGAIHSTHGDYKPGSVDWTPGADSVTVMTGDGACGKDSCFASELSRIDGLCTPYAPTGPNSNTVAKTLLSNCGLPVSKPVAIAPGFDDPML